MMRELKATEAKRFAQGYTTRKGQGQDPWFHSKSPSHCLTLPGETGPIRAPRLPTPQSRLDKADCNRGRWQDVR